MLSMVLRKISRNRWLVACLLAGTVLAVALVSSIPLYTSAILQRMLTRDLEIFQEQTSYFAGRYTVYGRIDLLSPAGSASFPELDGEIVRRVRVELGLPVLSEARLISAEYLTATARNPDPAYPTQARFARLEAISGTPDHVRMIQGRLFAPATEDGVIEVIVSDQARARRGLEVGDLYDLSNGAGPLTPPIAVRVVGVYDAAETRDLWWFQSPGTYDDSMLADYDALRSLIADPQTPVLSSAMWSFAVDYHAITLENLQRVAARLEEQFAMLTRVGLRYDSHMLPILRDYEARQRELIATLWFLQVPVLAMLAFYVYMVSLLITDAERTQIAVLKSRGASSGQVFLIYAVESGLFSAVALLLGPPLGLVICRFIGASNGFLEFVQREALSVRLSPLAYLFAGGCALLLSGAMLIPALLAARTTIVVHKQERARRKTATWRRWGLDLLLLAVTALGYYAYRWRRISLTLAGPEAGDLPLDPLLFLVSATFVLGAGLFFLRLYPALLRLVFRLGRRVWPTSLYATFVSVGRSGGYEQFIMLFLILTLSVGILNARSARTINRNVDETIRYAVGADITVRERWNTNVSSVPTGPLPAGTPTPQGDPQPLLYFEPDFDKYTTLAGVEKATRVFRTNLAYALLPGGKLTKVELMGIVPDEFASVAWFRPTMLPAHPNVYLNALSGRTNAFIVSEAVALAAGVRVGDTLNVTWAGQGYLDGVVAALVPFWPTYYPSVTEAGDPPMLVVANLTYVQAKMATEPYEVWLRKTPGAPSAAVYDALAREEVPIAALDDAAPRLLAARNDPLLQGTNGALSMGFVVAMIMCTIGFLIYWIITIETRQLQFGVLRAMGLSRRALLGMIGWEQVLVSLVGVAVGVVVGGVVSDLIVPLLELTRAVQRVPPFAVTASRADYVKIYIIVGAMLALALIVIGARISRIRIAQAIKLGED